MKRWFVLFLILTPVFAAAQEPQPEPSGVVVESIAGWALEDAGLQPGDVLLSWKRLPNPPANPDPAEGVFDSYFDWLDLTIEQVPRGTVVLEGRRDGKCIEFTVEPGLWDGEVRPVLPKELEEKYLEGKAWVDAGEVEMGVGVWEGTREDITKRNYRDYGGLDAWWALNIGIAWGKAGKWENATRFYLAALTRLSKKSSRFDLLEALSEAYWMQGKPDESMAILRNYEDQMDRATQETIRGSNWLRLIGYLFLERGDLKEARLYTSRALEIQRQISPRSLELSKTLNNMGSICIAEGLLEESEEYYRLSLEIRKQLSPRSEALANTLNNLGSIASKNGDSILSGRYYQSAMEIYREIDPVGIRVAVALNNIGETYRELGDEGGARSALLQSLEILERKAPETPVISVVLNNLGRLVGENGESERAEEYIKRALDISLKYEKPSINTARALNSLGLVMSSKGDYTRAFKYFADAVDILRSRKDSLDLAAVLNNLSRTVQELGDWNQAKVLSSEALTISQRISPLSFHAATCLSNAGTLAEASGDLNAAHAYYSEALKIFNTISPAGLGRVVSLRRLASVALARSDRELALSLLSQARVSLEKQVNQLRSSYGFGVYFREKYSEVYSDLADLLVDEGLEARGFEVCEGRRAQSFLTMLAEREIVFTADLAPELDRQRRRSSLLYDRAIRRLSERQGASESSTVESVKVELRRLEEQAGDIEAEIRRTSPKLAALQYPDPLDVKRAQSALDPGTLLLSFNVTEERIILFALPKTGDLVVKTLPLSEESLREQVDDFRAALAQGKPGSSLSERNLLRVREQARNLYTTLLKPVEELMAESERLLILPDGPLHALPFGALIREEILAPSGEQYLVEWKPLHMALSATVYAELIASRGPPQPDDIQFVAFGDPLYPGNLRRLGEDVESKVDPVVRSISERGGFFDWTPLPNTRHEIETIAEFFPKGSTRIYLGSEAREEQIKSLERNTRILHIAAHARTDENLPSSSFIALTIPETLEEGKDNGLLQVWEIFERIRIDADLVVLSACESGLGKELGSEGLIGLTRAFQYAGARSVAASLWSVEDQSTSELMIRFYRHLRSGLSKTEALRAAQIELIRSPLTLQAEGGKTWEMDASAPYYWAAFQIFGDWK